jgi:nitrogen fixation protein FixH
MTSIRKVFNNPWPVAIIAWFVIFTSGIVAFAAYAGRQRVELVHADYYAQEMQFQQQLDRLKRTQPIAAQVSITCNDKLPILRIILPPAHAHQAVSGRIHFYRPSDAGLDHEMVLAVDGNGIQEVNSASLQPGLWKVRLQWTVQGQQYFYEQSVVVGAGQAYRTAQK